MRSGPTDPEHWLWHRYHVLHHNCACVMMTHSEPLLEAAADVEVADDGLGQAVTGWVGESAHDLHRRALAGASWPRAGLMLLGDTRRLARNVVGDRAALGGTIPEVQPPQALRRHVNRHLREQADKVAPQETPTDDRRWREIDRISRAIEVRERHASRRSVAHVAAVAAALPAGALFDPFRDNVEALFALFMRRLPADEPAPDLDTLEGPVVDLDRAQAEKRVSAAFADLPVEMQEVLVVKLDLDWGPCAGLSQAGYCRHRGITESRLRTLYAQALERLRRAVDATGARAAR